MKRSVAFLAVLTSVFAISRAEAAVFEHVLCDSVSLNGDWEMAYRPFSGESVDCPQFAGVRVPNAVPGYWEDMVERFRAAGMTDEFRINPWYVKQTYPIFGQAQDTTLPQIYGTFLYRRRIVLDRQGPAWLAFVGVRNQVAAWINGKYVGFRAGFSTPFELEIPPTVLTKGTNEIVLAVSNCRNLGYGDYVTGLTTRSVFRSTGGVNGDLAIRFPKSDLADVYVTTAVDLKSFTVRVSGRDGFNYEISDGGRTLARGRAKGDFTLPAEGYSFWSPESPKRYTLRLKTAKGVVEQRFGLRRLTTAGEQFRLNGKPVYLRGVTEHCYFAKTIHLPRDLGYYRMVTAKRKELGFNFVRFHTFVPPEEYFEATDELGMLVHVETPNFVSEPEFAAIVAFARRHPSVVIYATGNETRIDRLAEAYLRDVAEIVHASTDSLFSPMSALRGLEYALVPGKDVIVEKPFRHNAERFGRVAAYSDLFTSYQLGATSYDSLNGKSAADLDAWGDAYCGKPRTSHETCIDGSYVDLSLEKLYPADSPMLKAGMFSGLRSYFAARGMLDRADVYYRNSCEWMWRIRKFTFEKLRASRRTSGYDFLGDINTHWHTFGYSVGMMDEFYRLKPGETVENVLRYNSAAVLLADLGSDFNVTAGGTKRVAFTLSNFADDARRPVLTASLVDAVTGESVSDGRLAPPDVPNGTVAEVGAIDFRVPATESPRKYLLKASLDGGAVRASNAWEIFAFPRVVEKSAPANVKVVTDLSEADLLAAMARGERVLLLGTGPFKGLASTFRIGMAGRCAGNFATVVRDHPVFVGFPHDGYCGWQFRRLLEGGTAIQLEGGVPFDPIVDIASSVKCVIRQSALFEYRIGEGRLLVCSFRFVPEDPAAVWLKARLADYAASDAFKPALALAPEDVRRLLATPLVDAGVNPNVARNPHDPSSAVRADALAQP